MSRLSGNVPQRKPTPNVYTVLAFVALIALIVSIFFTLQANLELNKTGDGVTGATPVVQPGDQGNPFYIIEPQGS